MVNTEGIYQRASELRVFIQWHLYNRIGGYIFVLEVDSVSQAIDKKKTSKNTFLLECLLVFDLK